MSPDMIQVEVVVDTCPVLGASKVTTPVLPSAPNPPTWCVAASSLSQPQLQFLNQLRQQLPVSPVHKAGGITVLKCWG